MNSTNCKWQRPSAINVPRVWHRFEKVDKNGQVIKFKIQDLTEEHFDDCFELSLKDFFKDEIWSNNCKIADNPLSLEVFKIFYKNTILPQNMSLVCLKDDNCQTKPEIIAFNYLSVLEKDIEEDYNELKKTENTETLLKLYGIFCERSPNVFEKYKVDKYLSGTGLCVNSKYRGANIGTEILKARKPLCEAMGIKISNTIFSGIVSQKCAIKAGFEIDSTISYDELRAATGLEFKNCTDCKMMTLRIE